MAVLDHVGPWLGVGLIDEGPGPLARRARLLAKLPGVAEVGPPFPGVERPATVAPTPADRRLIAALRARPRSSLVELAAAARLSGKTVARRYGRLAEGRALWSVPQVDFAGWRGAVFVHLLVHHPAGRGNDVVAAFTSAYPLVIDALAHEGGEEAVRELFVQLPSVAEVERAEALLLGLPGVTEVEVLFPRRFATFPGWFDERLAQVASAAATA
jgi:DNA-binding Lrp family transcriptional regulator